MHTQDDNQKEVTIYMLADKAILDRELSFRDALAFNTIYDFRSSYREAEALLKSHRLRHSYAEMTVVKVKLSIEPVGAKELPAENAEDETANTPFPSLFTQDQLP